MTMEQAICVIQAVRPMNGPNSKMINDALDFAIAAPPGAGGTAVDSGDGAVARMWQTCFSD